MSCHIKGADRSPPWSKAQWPLVLGKVYFSLRSEAQRQRQPDATSGGRSKVDSHPFQWHGTPAVALDQSADPGAPSGEAEGGKAGKLGSIGETTAAGRATGEATVIVTDQRPSNGANTCANDHSLEP